MNTLIALLTRAMTVRRADDLGGRRLSVEKIAPILKAILGVLISLLIALGVDLSGLNVDELAQDLAAVIAGLLIILSAVAEWRRRDRADTSDRVED